MSGRPCIAFKMNYCNGGKDSEHVGFNGTCEGEVIYYNAEEKKIPSCLTHKEFCMQYDLARNFDDSFADLENLENLNAEKFFCNESVVLRDWFVTAGKNFDGTPRKIKHAKENHLCILTTQRPNMPESDRIIFACFIIDKIFRGSDTESACIFADKFYRLEFKPRELHLLKFWQIFENQIGFDKFKYFSDSDAVKFLQTVIKVKYGTEEEIFAQNFLTYYCKLNKL